MRKSIRTIIKMGQVYDYMPFASALGLRTDRTSCSNVSAALTCVSLSA
jgi:hypothetical protein